MRLVAIVGTGRNGSTLLARLLDGIPGAYVHPAEANFLCAMNNLAWCPVILDNVQKNAVTRPLRHLHRAIPTRRLLNYYQAHAQEIEHDHLAHLETPLELGLSPKEQLGARSHYTPQEFVPAFLTAMASWLGQPSETLLFKTIETPYIADYERLFPTMRFIHILRDPVEVWSSQKRSLVSNKSCPPWYIGMDSLRSTIECRWLPHVNALAERRGHSQHFIVRYEDLIQDAQRVVQEITRWLNVPPPAEPTLQTVLGNRRLKSMVRYPSQKGVETPLAAVSDLKKRFQYDEVVTQRERDLIVLRTQHVARSFGYLVDDKAPGGHAVMRQWLPGDTWDFRHTRGLRSWLYTLYAFVSRRVYIARHCLSTPPETVPPLTSSRHE